MDEALTKSTLLVLRLAELLDQAYQRLDWALAWQPGGPWWIGQSGPALTQGAPDAARPSQVEVGVGAAEAKRVWAMEERAVPEDTALRFRQALEPMG